MEEVLAFTVAVAGSTPAEEAAAFMVVGVAATVGKKTITNLRKANCQQSRCELLRIRFG